MEQKWSKLLLEYEKHCDLIANATTLDINETLTDKLKRIKINEKQYVKWFEYYFPNYAKCDCAWFHADLANRVIKNKKVRELAEWYRSAAKSVHICMGIPLYLYLVKKDLNFMLLVGENDTKAKLLISDIQAQLSHNKRLLNDYGEKFKYGDWSDGDFSTVDNVQFTAIGFGMSPRGARKGSERPDYIVCDDVDNRKHINNDRLMEEGVSYINEDLMGCFDSTDTSTERFVYANNNFHKNSITNRLKKLFQVAIQKDKAEGIKSIFHVLTVNAVKDLATFEPEWPAKTSAEYWRKKYNNLPYRSFMREFMNTHVAEGSVFKAENILYGKMLPYDKYDALIFYGDLSYKDAGDYKAMILVGKTGKEFHVIHTYLSRGSRAKLAIWLYNLYIKHKLERYNIKYLIEGLFAMDEFVNDFDEIGEAYGFYIPVVPDKRSKANKFDRVESMSGFFERKNVIFNEAEKDFADQVTLIDQILAFEKGSKANDDGPDALQSAMSDLNQATFVDKFTPKTVSRRDLLQNSKNRF